MNQYNVAIVGATGAVGEVMLEILEGRNFPVRKLYLLASEKSVGKKLQFRGESVSVENLETFDFSKVQIGLFSAGGEISAEFAPKAASAGCIVIDNTSHFRQEVDIPLVVPEVNSHMIGKYGERKIIANPNCSTIQMLVALKPIYDAVGIKRINVATYQAVSGAGKRAVEALATETAKLLNGQTSDQKVFPQQIAFNAIPVIGDLHENGYSMEEMKMVWETRKIFEDESIEVNPTCVRIPVFFGHSEAVHIETKETISAAFAKELLSAAPGVEIIDDRLELDFPTPVRDAAGSDSVFVGRVRQDISTDRGLDLWLVSDNVRKGAALNSVQIAEVLIKNFN